jgi:hypothetical protein
MQNEPLLEQLDWFVTTPSWTKKFPTIVVLPLAKASSDHVPCMVTIDSIIPRANLFRFESYWVDSPSFLDCVNKSWKKRSYKQNSAVILAHKFKVFRADLKNGKRVSHQSKLS